MSSASHRLRAVVVAAQQSVASQHPCEVSSGAADLQMELRTAEQRHPSALLRACWDERAFWDERRAVSAVCRPPSATDSAHTSLSTRRNSDTAPKLSRNAVQRRERRDTLRQERDALLAERDALKQELVLAHRRELVHKRMISKEREQVTELHGCVKQHRKGARLSERIVSSTFALIRRDLRSKSRQMLKRNTLSNSLIVRFNMPQVLAKVILSSGKDGRSRCWKRRAFKDTATVKSFLGGHGTKVLASPPSDASQHLAIDESIGKEGTKRCPVHFAYNSRMHRLTARLQIVRWQRQVGASADTFVRASMPSRTALQGPSQPNQVGSNAHSIAAFAGIDVSGFRDDVRPFRGCQRR